MQKSDYVEISHELVSTINSLVKSNVINSIELSCAKISNLWVYSQNLDNLVIKSSIIDFITIQDTGFRNSFEVHNSDITTLNIQNSKILMRLLISRSNFSNSFIVSSSYIKDFQSYDFFKSEKPAENKYNYLNISSNEIGNIRFRKANNINYFNSFKNTYEEFSFFGRVNNRFELSDSKIDGTLNFFDLGRGKSSWGSDAYIDLSGTRTSSLNASLKSFINDSEKEVPINFSGFEFDRVARSISHEKTGPEFWPNIFDRDVRNLSDWIAQSFDYFKKSGDKTEVYFKFADHFEKNGRTKDANYLRVEAKSDEWWDRNKLVWLIGVTFGFGHQTTNLLWLLIFIPIGLCVKLRESLKRERAKPLGLILIEDLFFSVDRFFAPLLLQKDWDGYPNLTEIAKVYFYFHRTAGLFAITFGAISLLAVF